MTPIILDHNAEPVVHEQVLVNLCDEPPPIFSRYERLIEIVSLEDGDRERGRARFRFYRERGYDIRTHDLSKNQL
jgi:DNA polymerase-3 subunit chi